MVGLNFPTTLQPLATSNSVLVNTNPATPVNFFYMDGYMDNQRNPIIYQRTQQGNYAAIPGTGTLNCPYNDSVIPAANPLQCMYNAYGLTNSYGYTGCNVSPAMSYAQAVASTLPPNTGIIIAPTMNWINNSTSLGIRTWVPGAAAVAIGSATASLFSNVNHVLAGALSVSGAYMHSHLILFGETDAVANTLSTDQVSFNLQKFLGALGGSTIKASVLGQGVNIVAGNMNIGWMISNVTNGVNNGVSQSLAGIALRYRRGAFVNSYVNPLDPLHSAALGNDSSTASTAYFSSAACRTYGLNLFNYGYTTIPSLPYNTVTPPIIGLALSASGATNIQGSWSPSVNASAYDFIVTVIDLTNNLVITRSASTSGTDSFTQSGLTTGRMYQAIVSAVSEWGISTPVSAAISAGNSNGVIDWGQSTIVNTSGLVPSDGTTQTQIVVTLKDSSGGVIIGRSIGALSIMSDASGVAGTNTVTSPGGTITNASGQVTFFITNLGALQSGIVVWGLSGLTGSPGVNVTWNPINPTGSSISASVGTLNADGVSTTVVTVTLVNYSNALMVGYKTGLAITNNQRVVSAPGGIQLPGAIQSTSGSGVAAWTLLSTNFVGGNACVCSITNLTATAAITFTQEVSVAQCDFWVAGSSATTPNVSHIPPATDGTFVTAVTTSVSGAGTGLGNMAYTPNTINGITKNWLDFTGVYPLGNNKSTFQVQVPISATFSQSMWLKLVNPTAVIGGQYSVILGSFAFAAGNGFRNLYCSLPTVGNLTGLVFNVQTTQLSTPYPILGGITLGNWFHIVCVYDNTGNPTTNTAKIYVNGVMQGSTATAAQTGANATWAPAGGNTFYTSTGGLAANNSCASMLLADICQFNIALSQAQVTACYNSFLVNP